MQAWADTAKMGALATALEDWADQLGRQAAASASVLRSQDHWAAVATVGPSLESSATWASRWAASLHHRAAVLDTGDTIALSGLSAVALHADQGTLDALARLATLTGSTLLTPFLPPPGAPAEADDTAEVDGLGLALADELRAALDGRNAGAVLAVMNLLDQVADDPAVVDAFLVEIDLDTISAFPRRLHHELGVPVDDLHRYLGPLGRALGTATRSEDHPLPFTGADLMEGHDGASLSPAVYFDFGQFDPAFVLDALVAFLPSFDDRERLAIAPSYRVSDGVYASPDPRRPLLRALAETRPDLLTELVRRLQGQGALSALLTPATPWREDTAGVVVALLGRLDATGAGDHVEAVRAIIEGPHPRPFSPAVAVGIAEMIAPHLGSLAKPAFRQDLPTTRLGKEMESTGATGGNAVHSLMLGLVAVPEARRILLAGAADVMVSTITERFDPDDSSRLTDVADDIGAALLVVLDPALDHDLAVSRGADATAKRLGILASWAAAVPSALLASRLAALAADMAAGLGAEALAPSPDHVDRLLIETLDEQRLVRDQATLVIALLAHEHGMMEIPECLLDGPASLVPRHDAYWDALEAVLREGHLQSWTVAADAIAGRAIPTPRNGD